MRPFLLIALFLSFARLTVAQDNNGKCLSGDCQNGKGKKLLNESGDFGGYYQGNWHADTMAEPSKMLSLQEVQYLYDQACVNRKYSGNYTAYVNGDPVDASISISGFLGRDYTYSGREYPTLMINGKNYSCEVKIEGNFDSKTGVLNYAEKFIYASDPLPNGLNWILSANIILTLFKNKDVNDGYLLEGSLGDIKLVLRSEKQ